MTASFDSSFSPETPAEAPKKTIRRGRPKKVPSQAQSEPLEPTPLVMSESSPEPQAFLSFGGESAANEQPTEHFQVLSPVKQATVQEEKPIVHPPMRGQRMGRFAERRSHNRPAKDDQPQPQERAEQADTNEQPRAELPENPERPERIERAEQHGDRSHDRHSKGQFQRGHFQNKQNGHRQQQFQNKHERPERQQMQHPQRKPLFEKPKLARSRDASALNLGLMRQWALWPHLQSVQTLQAFLDARNTLPEGVEPSQGVCELHALYNLTVLQISQKAKEQGIIHSGPPQRVALIEKIVCKAWERYEPIHVQGWLDIRDDGNGMIVYERDHYLPMALSTFVPACLVKEFNLKKGQEILAIAHPPTDDHSCLVALKIVSVFGQEPEVNNHRVPFTELTPYYPLKRVLLETSNDANWDNLSMRAIDLLTPVGFGQRGLIVAPPRTGKTVIMHAIANSISENHPDAYLMVLLIDERPEEVTDFKRHTKAHVISSTFDEKPEQHVQVAEMAIAGARAMVEAGQHVIILLDSITRLARAYNALMPSSGKILSGGVEANALQGPKRFFGSARNIEDGGSLTILATALVETGSRMDEVIFEEFKGTGNMELHLDRSLSDKRIFPAINPEKSGTRKEELLYHPGEMTKIYGLRRAMKGVPANESMEMLLQRMKKSQSNAEFLMGLGR